MAVEYTWTWGPMKVETVNGIENVVTGINWVCAAKDPDISNTITSVESGIMLTPSVNPDSYVTINELTDTIINSWIDTGIDKSVVEAKVLLVLNEQLAPKVTFIDVPVGVNPVTTTFDEIPAAPLDNKLN